jgi:hypothetical protein
MAWGPFSVFFTHAFEPGTCVDAHALADEGDARGLTWAEPVFLIVAMVNLSEKSSHSGSEESDPEMIPIKR